MIEIPKSYIPSLMDQCRFELKNGKVKVIKMDDYLNNMLNQSSNEISYPYVINVPRDIDYMLKTGDLSPLQTITLQEPYLYKGAPVWTKSSAKGIDLGFGYKNGDKRYLSEYFIGDNSDTSGPHMVIGGTSGGGKSVCVNNLLFNIMMGYSPFEVNLYMIDAKIAEFRRYAGENICPHIRAVGATSDTSYVISLLQELNALMLKMNKLFGSVGVNNIKDFRKVTGLTLPRIIVIVDEYQLQYELATSKEENLLTSQYNQFCTAGRSAGIHLVLCSQSFLSELKSKLFHNIRLRACLTCDAKTSEGILGNTVASKAVPIGQIHVNIAADQSLENTQMYKVPYQNDEDFLAHNKFLADLGKDITQRFGYEFSTNFYDEEFILGLEPFEALVKKYSKRGRLVLGTPSFVKSKEIDVHYLDQTFDDLENIVCYSPKLSDVKEMMHIMNENFKKMSPAETRCNYLVVDKPMAKDLILPSYGRRFNCDKTTDAPFIGFLTTIYKKNCMVDADDIVFGGDKSCDADVVERMHKRFGKDSSMCTPLNYSRVTQYVKLLSDPLYAKILGVTSLKKADAITHAMEVLEDLVSYSQEFLNKKCDSENIPTHYFSILGYDKLRGLYRDSKHTTAELFKNLMYDTYKSRCCVLVYSTNVASLSSIKDTFGRVIVSNSGDVGAKLGIDLPASFASSLCIITNPSSGHSARFKRLSVYEETI